MVVPKQLLYASRMTLRPNPVMQLHVLLAKRNVLHIDVFAAVREHAPNTVLFSIELRAGGRGEPVARIYRTATLNSDDPPMHVDGRTALVYDITDTVRFNALPREWYDWACPYHHKHMLPLIERARRPGYNHRSILFHYFRVYDLDPSKGFHNFKRLTEGQRYRALRWGTGGRAFGELDGSELL